MEVIVMKRKEASSKLAEHTSTVRKSGDSLKGS